MTRSNLYVILSDGTELQCVADSSSAPEQEYIVEQLLLPLLHFDCSIKENELLMEHCTMNELRINATYRYHINLIKKTVSFHEEIYHWKKDVFSKGQDLTERYNNYVTMLQK